MTSITTATQVLYERSCECVYLLTLVLFALKTAGRRSTIWAHRPVRKLLHFLFLSIHVSFGCFDCFQCHARPVGELACFELESENLAVDKIIILIVRHYGVLCNEQQVMQWLAHAEVFVLHVFSVLR